VRDAVEDTEGAQGSVLYMPLVPRWAIGLARGPDALRVLWQPAVGVEYEHVAKAGAGRPTGSVSRLNAGVDLAFYPADGRLKKRLEIALSWMYWRDFAEASGLDDVRDSHRRWKATLSYAVDAGDSRTSGTRPSRWG